MHFAADGVTSFSAKPLRIASYVGIIVFILGLAYAVFAILQNISGKTIPGLDIPACHRAVAGRNSVTHPGSDRGIPGPDF